MTGFVCTCVHSNNRFSLGHVQLPPVDPLALDAEAEQVTDVLLALGLLGQLLALALLPSLLKLTNERGVLRVLTNEKPVREVITKNTD